jgi:hypothetical protein
MFATIIEFQIDSNNVEYSAQEYLDDKSLRHSKGSFLKYLQHLLFVYETLFDIPRLFWSSKTTLEYLPAVKASNDLPCVKRTTSYINNFSAFPLRQSV